MVKGETLKLSVTDGDALSVEFRFGGPEARAIAATKNGTEFSISADTANWQSGVFVWQAWATFADSVKAIISDGTFDLEAVLGIGDVRTSARKMVEMIQAMMAGNASEGVRRYKINNRELERYSVAELLQLLSYWKAQVKNEVRAAGGRSTLGPRISVRF